MKHLFGLYSKFTLDGKFYECVGFAKQDGEWKVVAQDGTAFPLARIAPQVLCP